MMVNSLIMKCSIDWTSLFILYWNLCFTSLWMGFIAIHL